MNFAEFVLADAMTEQFIQASFIFVNAKVCQLNILPTELLRFFHKSMSVKDRSNLKIRQDLIKIPWDLFLRVTKKKKKKKKLLAEFIFANWWQIRKGKFCKN